MPNCSKCSIRNTIKKRRSKISLTERLQASQQICAYIQTLESYQNAKHIALYYAAPYEIDLSILWDAACLQKKCCYFPVLDTKKTLSFLPATAATCFKKNKYGLLEPDSTYAHAIPIEKLDLIILPLVAFDKHGTRLGMGGGYYDKILANKKNKILLGVAFQFQKVDFIPPDPWDIPLSAIITPKSIYWRS